MNSKHKRNRYTIIGNGEYPSKKLLQHLLKATDVLVCTDGTLRFLVKRGLRPDVVIGDFDTDNVVEVRRKCKRSVVKKINRQSDTDLEKAVKYCISKKAGAIAITGVFGKRADHSLANIALLLRYHKLMDLAIYTNETVVSPLSGKNMISVKQGETISLFGFDRRTKVTTIGLRFPLIAASLALGGNESISNAAERNTIEINVKNGIVLMIRSTNTVLSQFRYV